jgi:hypothetical protein
VVHSHTAAGKQQILPSRGDFFMNDNKDMNDMKDNHDLKDRYLTFWTLAGALAVLLTSASIAAAHPQFQKQFLDKYVKGNSNKEFVTLVQKKAKCFVCHDTKKDDKGKTNKKNRNAYGNELAKLITKNDRKDVKKIQDALEKVSKLKSDTKDPNSPTFGDLIAQGKLPAGTPPADGADEAEEEEEEETAE